MTKTLSASTVVFVLFVDEVLVPTPMVTSGAPETCPQAKAMRMCLHILVVRSRVRVVYGKVVDWISGRTWSYLGLLGCEVDCYVSV